ncbi:MAG TPA: DEAD/DEAH box helicase family protein, partial [Chloroflexota bacterium]|nr:DEAD/DEAH box helicase family protein [Chloroflexota bacterium]
ISQGQRRALLTMATGTGKTYMALQIAWKLYRAGRIRRLLFLADRLVLRDQAYNAFAAFEDARAVVDEGKAPKTRDVYFAIYQSLYSTVATDDGNLAGLRLYERYPRDFFDLVIIDEAHRSGFGTWGTILKHFEGAVHLGMTATPKREDNIDTYAYFGEPVYSYSLAQGIRDGFLATYRVHRVQTNVDKQGVTLTDAKEQGAEVFVPPDAEPRDHYDQGQFEREISLPDRTRVICTHLANLLDADDPLQKTIVFCVSQDHALEVARHLQNHFGPRYGLPDYAVRIVADEHDAQGLIEQFQDADKRSPVVATTVDLLSTGVDIPSLRNVVFLRPISSPVVFKQIIGRGSRVDEAADKLWFRIVDYTNATRLFDAWEEVPEPPEPGDDGPDDYYLTGQVLDQETKCPIAGASVLVESGPNTTEQRKTNRSGSFGCSALTRTGVKVVVSAIGYRRREVHCRTSPTPDKVVAIPLAPYKQTGDKVIRVKGLTITVEDELYVELDASGQRLTLQQYINHAKAELFHFAQDEDTLRRLWLDPAKRKEMLSALLEVNVSPEAIAALLHHTDADAYDVLASVAFGREAPTREQRVTAFTTRNADFINSFPPAAREVLLALLDKYRLGGVGELEQAEVLRTPPFDRMGYAPGVVQRFGDAQRFRTAIAGLTQRLYEA